MLGRDLVGHKWGRMEVIAPAEKPEGDTPMIRGTWWLCRCACGVEKVLPRQYITQETSKSCGCLRLKPDPPKQEKPEKPPQEETAGKMKLSKNDRLNLRDLKECKCKRCKKEFIRTSPYWKYTRIINGHRLDYCSWE